MLENITRHLLTYGPFGILLLAFVDSAGVPVSVAMDALIIVMSAENPSGAVWYAMLGIVGSAAGNVVLFWVARHGGRRFLDKEAPPGRSRRFRAWFLRYGLLTVFIPALVPIPLPMKIFVISAGALEVPIASFMGVVLLARVLRYGGEAWLGAQVGEHSARYLKDHLGGLVFFAILLFLVLYLLVRFSDRWRRPASGLG